MRNPRPEAGFSYFRSSLPFLVGNFQPKGKSLRHVGSNKDGPKWILLTSTKKKDEQLINDPGRSRASMISWGNWICLHQLCLLLLVGRQTANTRPCAVELCTKPLQVFKQKEMENLSGTLAPPSPTQGTTNRQPQQRDPLRVEACAPN